MNPRDSLSEKMAAKTVPVSPWSNGFKRFASALKFMHHMNFMNSEDTLRFRSGRVENDGLREPERSGHSGP